MDEPDPREALLAKVKQANEHLRESPPALLVLAFAKALAAGDAEEA